MFWEICLFAVLFSSYISFIPAPKCQTTHERTTKDTWEKKPNHKIWQNKYGAEIICLNFNLKSIRSTFSWSNLLLFYVFVRQQNIFLIFVQKQAAEELSINQTAKSTWIQCCNVGFTLMTSLQIISSIKSISLQNISKLRRNAPQNLLCPTKRHK